MLSKTSCHLAQAGPSCTAAKIRAPRTVISFCDHLKPRLQSSKQWTRYCINIVSEEDPRVQRLFSRQPKQQKATSVPTWAPGRHTGTASGPHKHTAHCTGFECAQRKGTPIALSEPQVQREEKRNSPVYVFNRFVSTFCVGCPQITALPLFP
ncbi:hypothetical protein HJG60_008143 [Phyllostomus discolor]|uniref:Uncharacterized protein n=1 Tax=Phyllostomus discolor TaxID=89673 RepID=A0A833Z3T6_9CHIR|nr:hypothetical protein HJG60_008143 [Phyllostomus discolor]